MTIYRARLAIRLTTGTGARLRQLALIRRQRINRVLADLLDTALPTAAEPAARMAGPGSDQADDGDDRTDP